MATIEVVVNGRRDWLESLRQRLARALEELDLGADRIQLTTRKPPAGTGVQAAILFGNPNSSPSRRQLQRLVEYIDDEIPVLPVVDTVKGYRTKVPKELGKVNSFALGTRKPDFGALVARLLDLVWHQRRVRKIFISYRRIDSAAIARQLQAKLTHRGYHVFLDESTIPPAANFQRELLSWINDADFLLLLASPRLGDSKWVMEEITAAQVSHVGILALCWPRGSGRQPEPVRSLFPDQKIQLSRRNFRGRGAHSRRQLNAGILESVVRRVEDYRARAIHLRMTQLVPLLGDTVKEAGLALQPAERFGDFHLQAPGARDPGARVRVLPFRPTLASVKNLKDDLVGETSSDKTAACFYIENDVNDPQKTALDWALDVERRAGEMPSRFRLLPWDAHAGDHDTRLRDELESLL